MASAAVVVACGGSSTSARTVEIAITPAGCEPATVAVPSGSTAFHVKNNGADNVTEFEVLDAGGKIIGEKENLTPGLEATVTIDLKSGNYSLACPGGSTHATGTLTVSS